MAQAVTDLLASYPNAKEGCVFCGGSAPFGQDPCTEECRVQSNYRRYDREMDVYAPIERMLNGLKEIRDYLRSFDDFSPEMAGAWFDANNQNIRAGRMPDNWGVHWLKDYALTRRTDGLSAWPLDEEDTE